MTIFNQTLLSLNEIYFSFLNFALTNIFDCVIFYFGNVFDLAFQFAQNIKSYLL
jgi:hypothetical protein